MADNLVQLLWDAVERHPSKTAQQFWDGTSWKNRTYHELWDAITGVGRGLRSRGIKPGDRIGILSHTRPEWVIADFAILSLGAITVPIYPSVPADQVNYIVEDAAMDWIFVETSQLAAKVPQGIRCIFFESADQAVTLTDLSESGDSWVIDGDRNTLATLVYTSGTTGVPKGVMLTHANILANIEAIGELCAKNEWMTVGTDDVVLSFLPLSHILERMVHAFFLSRGVVVAYAESADRVASNLLSVRPTLMVSVPRVFEKIYAQVLDQVHTMSPLKRSLFHAAVAAGLRRYETLLSGRRLGFIQTLSHQFYQRWVFSRIRGAVGGRLRLVVSGGAPLSPEIGRFFYAAGIPILEGYGLTETSPVVSLNLLPLPHYGTAGKPLTNVKVQIAEDGEILTQGPNVALGYWNRPEETDEAFHKGWFHTGDVGEITHDGYLRITDRKKYLLVLSTGKNVAPMAVEQRLILSPIIDQAVVLGNRRKFVSALLHLEPQQVLRWAQTAGLDSSNYEELLKEPSLLRYVENEVSLVVKELAAFERPKRIRLLPSPLSEATGELTPSLKVRLAVIENKYHDLIESMYTDALDGDELIQDLRVSTPFMPWALLAVVVGVVAVVVIRFVAH